MATAIPVIVSPARFRPMREANVLLDDKPALWRQFDADGYLFFRDVLDRESIRRLQDVYADELRKQGLIEEGDPEFRYNDADLSRFPVAGGAILPAQGLHERQPWRAFLAEPAIAEFFRRLLGYEAFWLPIVEYKAVPPGKRGPTRFNFVHQDSFYNQGIPCTNCWFPLSDINADAGGIALAEGMHKGATFHNVNEPPAYWIPPGAIPDEAWVRSDYRPGDLLIMNFSTPHSGLTNHSDRFRLSMDIRFMPPSDKVPFVGKAVSVTPERIVIENEDGRIGDFIIDDDTYFRHLDMERKPRSAAAQIYHPGDELIVAALNGRATIIRRTSSAARAKDY